MQWNVDILALPAADPDNFLIATIYDATAPGVVVDFIPLAKPYTGASIQVTFLNVDPIVYDFKLWENATPDPGGILRNTFSFQPTTSTIRTRADLYLITDNTTDDPVSGETQYLNDSLEGWTYDIERVGQGTMFPLINYQIDEDLSDPENLIIGWHLIQPGDVFNPEERFVMRFQPIVGTTSISAVVNAAFSGVRVITEDDSIDAADAGKAILIQADAVDIVVQLPSLADVSDFKLFSIYSGTGNHYNATLEAQGSDEINYTLPDTQKIILGRIEVVKMYKYNNQWQIDFASPGVLDVGAILWTYEIGKVNTIVANGQILDRVTFPRLWAHAQATGAVVAEASWNATAIGTDAITRNINHGKFSDGDGVGTFRAPKLTEYGYMRAVDGGSRLAGSLQQGQVGAFDLELNGKIFAKSGNNNQLVTIGNINDADLGDRDVDMGVVNTGMENYPTNVGMYALMRI